MTRLAVLSLHTSPLMVAGLGDAGGMNVYIRELMSSLARIGIDVTVFVRQWHRDITDEVEVEPGFRVVHVPAGPVELGKESLLAVTDEFADGVLCWLAEHPADVLHANYWLSGVAGHRLKHQLSLPLVSTFHTLARAKASAGDRELAHLHRDRVAAEEEVMACSDAITANSEAESRHLVDLYDVDPGKIEVVRPGVSTAFAAAAAMPRRAARRALGIDDEPLLLFVGRIQPLKGACLAVEALAELGSGHDDARLLVIGGASGTEGQLELRRLNSTIASCGLEKRVRLVSPQVHPKLAEYYRAADVCLVPSRSESFGLVALEAAACGVPVVAADVGGLRSIVQDGRTGFLVSERSPAAYADAVRAVLGDPRRAADMGRRAALAASRHTWQATAARFRRVLSGLEPLSPAQMREECPV